MPNYVWKVDQSSWANLSKSIGQKRIIISSSSEDLAWCGTRALFLLFTSASHTLNLTHISPLPRALALSPNCAYWASEGSSSGGSLFTGLASPLSLLCTSISSRSSRGFCSWGLGSVSKICRSFTKYQTPTSKAVPIETNTAKGNQIIKNRIITHLENDNFSVQSWWRFVFVKMPIKIELKII